MLDWTPSSTWRITRTLKTRIIFFKMSTAKWWGWPKYLNSKFKSWIYSKMQICLVNSLREGINVKNKNYSRSVRLNFHLVGTYSLKVFLSKKIWYPRPLCNYSLGFYKYSNIAMWNGWRVQNMKNGSRP